MFPADNPISHVIPNWMRIFGLEYFSPLPYFVSTLNRVSELAVQPVARSSFDVLARRSLQCFSWRNWESSVEPRGPRGVVCQPPTLPRGCDLEPFRFPSLRLLASWTAVSFPHSPSSRSVLRLGMTQIHHCAILGTFPRDSFLFRPVPPSFRNPPNLYSFHHMKSISWSYCSLPVLQALKYG
jgi:hypothetical protein